MGLFKKITCLCLPFLVIYGNELGEKRHILYLMKTQEIERALDAYLALYNQDKRHDFEILEEMCNLFLEKGMQSSDPEEEMIALYGVQLSLSSTKLSFLESAIKSKSPYVQAAALQILGTMHDDQVDEIITRALASEFLWIRFEAIHQLVMRKSKHAIGYVQSLSGLLPRQFLPYFVEFYAAYGSPESIQILKSFTSDQDVNVQIAAILFAAFYNRDDLISAIRCTLSQSNPVLKEASAFALGILSDLGSKETLEEIASSPFIETKLSALSSLYRLGFHERGKEIIEIAKGGNLYAISLLSEIPEGKETLESLASHPQINVRINTLLALLKTCNLKAKPLLLEILNTQTQSIGFAPFITQGHSLMCMKEVPLVVLPKKELKQSLMAITLNFQEELLSLSLDLPPNHFLEIAKWIKNKNLTQFYPTLIHLLENHPTPEIIDFLKEKRKETIDPLFQAYTKLSLYRMNVDRESKEIFFNWLKEEKGEKMIEFRPMVERGAREDKSEGNFTLSPEETSRLLIESFDTIAQKHDLEGLTLLIEMMRDGHPKNRACLAGLLLKSIR